MNPNDNMGRGPRVIAPPPVSADIGIVAAMAIEVSPLLDQLKNIRKYAAKGQKIIEGSLDGKLIVVVLTGMGRARAQRGAERLIDGHRPRWIISPGFAGGLNPSIPRLALRLPVEVANIEGNVFPIEWPAGIEIPAKLERSGRLLTVDEIYLKAAQKAKLHEDHHADLLDMETSSVAAYCLQRNVRFLSLRIVSDDANTDLPPEILSIVGDSGSYRVGAAIGAIWKRPASLKELLKLQAQTGETADLLCKALRSLISVL
jgi:adenosylhomocysteine nucleosidase